MLDLYVEALLADPDLADQVWEFWNAGVITDGLAAMAWCILADTERQLGNYRRGENLMEWIAIYVLTMSYCIAPEGKTVCERQDREYTFAESSDCVRMRNLLVDLYDRFPNVIVYSGESKCRVEVESVLTDPDREYVLERGNDDLKIAVEIWGDDF